MAATRPIRERNPRGQGERLRAEILAATSRLLEKLGSEEALSLRAVAREVGIAAPSIYLHFPDKTALVWAALADKYEQLAEAMRHADAAAPADDPLARLRAQVHAYVRFAIENPGHYRLLYGLRQSPVEPERLEHHPTRVVLESLGAALARCEQAGYRLRLPCRSALFKLWAALHGMITLSEAIPGGRTPQQLHQFADELLVLLLELPEGAF